MTEWERLEAEATAAPVKLVGRNRVGHDGLGASLPGGGRAVFDEPAEASLHVYLRNRSPQLRAVVEAARNVDRLGRMSPTTGRLAEYTAAQDALTAALRALDEVGHE